MKIIPSIYEKTPQGFSDQIKKLSSYFSSFQIDISDGIYAPNRTIQIEDINKLVNYELQITDKIQLDFHLMVNDYEVEIKKLINFKNKINVSNILIHYSLHPNYSLLTTHYSIPIGLVLNSEDQVSNLVRDYNIKKIPVIQIMTVQIGAQGNPFLPENIKKVEQLKKAGFSGEIFIDGGINDKTLPLFLSQKYQPDALCPGSYLTKVEKNQLLQRVDFLKKQLGFEALR